MSSLTRNGKGANTHTQGKGTCEAELKTETRAMLPQAQEHQEPAEDGESRGKEASPSESLDGALPCTHLDFEILASRTTRESFSIVLKSLALYCCSCPSTL